MHENLTNELLTEVKHYLRLRKELFETETTIRVTKVVSTIVIIISALIMSTLTLTFFVIAIVSLLKIYVGDILAFTIGGVMFIIFWVIFYIFRKTIIVNTVAKFLSTIIKL